MKCCSFDLSLNTVDLIISIQMSTTQAAKNSVWNLMHSKTTTTTNQTLDDWCGPMSTQTIDKYQVVRITIAIRLSVTIATTHRVASYC